MTKKSTTTTSMGMAMVVVVVHLLLFINGVRSSFRGVAPRDEAYYATELIKCRDGSNKFSTAQLNDDFCDCPDGTDEPGTSACPNGRFYCTNAGHSPKILFSSRVNDGICDCCDGSDEYHNNSVCPNTCWVAGKAARDKLAAKISTFQQGLSIRRLQIQQAKAALAADQAELSDLKSQEKTLKPIVHRLKDQKEQIEKAEEVERQEAAAKAKEHTATNDVDDDSTKIQQPAHTDDGDDDSTKIQQPAHTDVDDDDSTKIQQPAHTDVDDDDSTTIQQPAHTDVDDDDDSTTIQQPAHTDDDGDDSTTIQQPAHTDDDGDDSTKIGTSDDPHDDHVEEHHHEREIAPPLSDIQLQDKESPTTPSDGASELSREELGRLVASRWTGESTGKQAEDANSVDNNRDDDDINEDVEEPAHTDEDEAYASETDDDHQRYDEDNDADDDFREEDPLHSTSSYKYEESDTESDFSDTTPNPSLLEKIQLKFRNILQAVNIFQTPVNQSDAARVRKEFDESSGKLTKIQSRISSLTQKLKHDFGPDKEFYSFYDKCFESKESKYVYKVCPYKHASQEEGHSSTRLGRWDKFEDSYKVMIFANGDKCWNGPDRSLTVKLRCGLKNEVTDVDEPSRCEYVALLSTPALCGEGRLKELQHKLEEMNKEQPQKHDEL